MGSLYVDTSALGRVLLEEPDKLAIKDTLDTFKQLTASRLLRVELRRVGLRRGLLDRVETLLADISLIPIDDQTQTVIEVLSPS